MLEKLYNSTNKILVISEPGTPEGFTEIKSIRDYFIEKKSLLGDDNVLYVLASTPKICMYYHLIILK